MLLLSHFAITATQLVTTSVSLSTYCNITIAATVTVILVNEVVNMQTSLNSGF